jgi:hypothetical protein
VAARGNTFVVAGGTERGPGDYDPGPGTQIIDGQFRFLSIFDY